MLHLIPESLTTVKGWTCLCLSQAVAALATPIEPLRHRTFSSKPESSTAPIRCCSSQPQRRFSTLTACEPRLAYHPLRLLKRQPRRRFPFARARPRMESAPAARAHMETPSAGQRCACHCHCCTEPCHLKTLPQARVVRQRSFLLLATKAPRASVGPPWWSRHESADGAAAPYDRQSGISHFGSLPI